MKKPGMMETIRTAPIEEVVEVVRHRKAGERRYVRAFLARCHDELVKNPRSALDLAIQGPDYVRRVLADECPNYLAWSYGTVATCGSARKLPDLAHIYFERAYSVEGASQMETAALNIRKAYHELPSDWSKSHALVNDAIRLSAASMAVNEDPETRDDKNTAFFIASRGTILEHGVIYANKVATIKPAIDDYIQAIHLLQSEGRSLKGKYFLTTQTALLGLARVSIRAWLSGNEAPKLSAREVLAITNETRKIMHKRKLPIRSIIGCYRRWVEGFALFISVRHLTREVYNILASARDDFVFLDRPEVAVELTLDLQWCMLHSGRYAEAIEECDFLLQHIANLPEKWQWMLHSWKYHLDKHRIEYGFTRKIFREIRGVADVRLPAARLQYQGDSGGW